MRNFENTLQQPERRSVLLTWFLLALPTHLGGLIFSILLAAIHVRPVDALTDSQHGRKTTLYFGAYCLLGLLTVLLVRRRYPTTRYQGLLFGLTPALLLEAFFIWLICR